MQTTKFRGNPFYLGDEDIAWVENTLASMTEDQKIGQLFFLITYGKDAAQTENIVNKVRAGGVMCRCMPIYELTDVLGEMQKKSAIPLLVAANLEAGGNGIVAQGTLVGSQMSVAATGDPENAARLGEVCAEEGRAVGANYAFAPVCDIDYNFRNPITNTRTYGADPAVVAECASRSVRECQSRGLAVSVKHFPGDGRDERDQHLCTTVNDLSCEEWDKTYGAIYSRLIKEGAKTFMVGHIMQPAYSKALNPALKDSEIMPASLSKELLCGLLHKALADKLLREGGLKLIKRYKVSVTLAGKDNQVTCGGADLKEWGSDMRSKLHKGLYCIGEMADVDGECGGFNLHWAWVSALACADAVLAGERND